MKEKDHYATEINSVRETSLSHLKQVQEQLSDKMEECH
jgi:hypothetical protein